MKKIWHFLQWQWRQFETWQKFYLFAMALIGASVTASEERRIYFFAPGAAIIVFFMLKWLFWDGVKSQWNKYNAEQEKIVDILKDTK